MKQLPTAPLGPPPARLGEKLRALRLRKGWNMDRVASAAGISRTTLFHLERGATPRPHVATLHKLAAVFGVSAETLAAPSEPAPARSLDLRSLAPPDPFGDDDEETRRRFDRETNPAVAVVADEHPALFAGWSSDDWDELTSQFATGGPLTEEGVRAVAADINRHRETVQQLRLLLHTHLAHVAANLVDALFQMVAVSPEPEKFTPDRATPDGGAENP